MAHPPTNSFKLMYNLHILSVNSDEIKKVSNPLVNLTHEKSRQEKEVGQIKHNITSTHLHIFHQSWTNQALHAISQILIKKHALLLSFG